MKTDPNFIQTLYKDIQTHLSRSDFNKLDYSFLNEYVPKKKIDSEKALIPKIEDELNRTQNNYSNVKQSKYASAKEEASESAGMRIIIGESQKAKHLETFELPLISLLSVC